MTLDKISHVLFVSDFDLDTKKIIEELPYTSIDSTMCSDKLISIYLNNLCETDIYKKVIMFIHNEDVVKEKIANDLKNKLSMFKYLTVLNKQQEKNGRANKQVNGGVCATKL